MDNPAQAGHPTGRLESLRWRLTGGSSCEQHATAEATGEASARRRSPRRSAGALHPETGACLVTENGERKNANVGSSPRTPGLSSACSTATASQRLAARRRSAGALHPETGVCLVTENGERRTENKDPSPHTPGLSSACSTATASQRLAARRRSAGALHPETGACLVTENGERKNGKQRPSPHTPGLSSACSTAAASQR